MDWANLLKPLLVGMLTGGICAGGLQLGIRLISQAQSGERLSPQQKKWRVILGGTVLIGQLFAALAILFYSNAAKQNPLWLGLGLIGSTFALSLAGGSKSE